MTSRRNRIVDRPSTLFSAFANPAHPPSEESLRSTLPALDLDPGDGRAGRTQDDGPKTPCASPR